MENLILTIIAAGLLGGIVFMIGMCWYLTAHGIFWIDAWAEARAIMKSDLCILIDRIHRGWFEMMPILQFRPGPMNGGTWRIADRSTTPKWAKMQERDK